ncbi:MAG TPA: hypothetical protein VH878_05245 [Thermodesulfobacteriota bacterium]|jgi:hypothetical protein
MGVSKFRQVLAAMEELEAPFDWKAVAEKSGASASMVQGLVAGMAKLGYLEATRRGAGPIFYTPIEEKRGFVQKYDEGEFDGFWAATAGRKQKRQSEITSTEPSDDLEEIEINPLEVFEEMGEEDFVKLISVFLRQKNQAIEPLQQEVERLTTEVRFLNGEKVNLNQRHATEVTSLRDELRVERERNMELRTEMAKVKGEMITLKEQVKVILVRDRRSAPAQKDSGGTGVPGAAFNSIRMHRKPATKHAPAIIITRRKRSH